MNIFAKISSYFIPEDKGIFGENWQDGVRKCASGVRGAGAQRRLGPTRLCAASHARRCVTNLPQLSVGYCRSVASFASRTCSILTMLQVLPQNFQVIQPHLPLQEALSFRGTMHPRRPSLSAPENPPPSRPVALPGGLLFPTFAPQDKIRHSFGPPKSAYFSTSRP